MPGNIFKRIKNIFFKEKSLQDKNELTIDQSFEASASIKEQYDSIIYPHIPYYRSLVSEEKELFIKRVYVFQNNKHFHFLDLEEDPEMPILVSAVAIEITFGLDNYLLPFFKNIFLISDVYQVLNREEWYLGHVAPSGIYISWKHFLEGFENSDDNFNAGLHEFAHAVQHQNFIEEKGIDWEFKEDFEKLSEVFGPILTQSLIEHKSYLRGYAFTNFQEFWAVSVEAFFENPQGLKDNVPGLYEKLCITLRQDPLAKYKRLVAKE